MEVIENQNKRIDELQKENRLGTEKYRKDFAGLNMDQKEILGKMKQYEELERECKQLNMLYRNEAAAKSALHRESVNLKQKVAKKKEKVEVTKQQLEATVRQVNQLQNDNTQLGHLMRQMQQFMPEAKKGELTSEVVFSSQMDDIMRSSVRASNIRQSVNVDLGNRGTMNIKKSIRGGAGSMYRKGPNMTMDMGASSPSLGGEK